MVRVMLTTTTKSYSPKDQWRRTWDEELVFDLEEEFQDWMRERYGKSRRRSMYRDTKNGPKKVGWVIGFRNEEYDHDGRGKYRFLQQDWVEVRRWKEVGG